MKRKTASHTPPKAKPVSGAGTHPYRQTRETAPANPARTPEPPSTANSNNGRTPNAQSFKGRPDTPMSTNRDQLRDAIRKAEDKLDPRKRQE